MTEIVVAARVEAKLEKIRLAANSIYEFGCRSDDHEITSQALIILAALAGVRKVLDLPAHDIRFIHTEGEA